MMKRMGALLAVAVVVAWAVNLSAGEPGKAPPNGPAPTWADLQKLQNEVREQRQLIIQLMQSEQQRYDMLLRLIQGADAGDGRPRELPAPLSGGSTGGAPGLLSPPSNGAIPTKVARERTPERRLGTVEGTVSVSGDKPDAIYVYVDNLRMPAAHNRTFEIKQEGKKFVPAHAVVQVGTNVVFPNMDTVFHNVFSNSSRNSFDLGSYRSGDAAKAVTFSSPGVVDVYCNMHQGMGAHVLVVPNRLYAKVGADGSYRIEGVPVGDRRLVAWAPNLKPAQKSVDLSAGGARADFNLVPAEKTSHTNKFGQAYGSYKE